MIVYVESNFVLEMAYEQDEAAFNDVSLKAELSLYNCRYIKTFRDGLQFIKSKI